MDREVFSNNSTADRAAPMDLVVVEADASQQARYRDSLIPLATVTTTAPEPSLWDRWLTAPPTAIVLGDRTLVELLATAPTPLPAAAAHPSGPRPLLVIITGDREDDSLAPLWQRLEDLDSRFWVELVPDRPDALRASVRLAMGRSQRAWERDQLEQQQRWWQELAELQRHCRDRSDLIQRVVNAIGRWFHGARVVFYCRDRSTIASVPPPRQHEPSEHRGLDTDAFATITAHLDANLPLAVITADPHAPSDRRQQHLAHSRLHSEAVLPLYVSPQTAGPWGMLTIQHQQPHRWHPCDLTFLARLASPLALAIETTTDFPMAVPQRLMRAALDTSDNPIAIVDADGHPLTINAAFRNITGYTATEIAHLGGPLALHDPTRSAAATTAALKHHQPWRGPVRLHSPEGPPHDAILSITPWQDGSRWRAILTYNIAPSLLRLSSFVNRTDNSASYLRMLVDYSPVIFYAIDVNGTFTLSEGPNLHRIGLEPGEVVGQNVFDLYRHNPDICRYLREALTGRRTHWRTDIEGVLYENRVAPIRDETGAISGIVGVATDITDRGNAERALQSLNADLENRVSLRTQELKTSNEDLRHAMEDGKRIEQTLQRQRAEFAAILNSVPDAVIVISPMGQIVLTNPALEQLLGRTSQSVLGQSLRNLKIMEPAPLESVMGEIERGTDDSTVLHPLNMTVRHHNGLLIPVEARSAPVWDNDRQLIGVVVILRDIRRRQRTEVALQRSESRFRRLSTNIPGILCQFQRHINGHYTVNYVSEQFQPLCGQSPTEIYAHPHRWMQVLHPDDRRSFYLALAASAETQERLSWEGRLQLEGDRTYWIECIAQPETQLDGSVLWDGLIINTSDRKETEDELAQQRDLRMAFFQESADALFLVDPTSHLTLDCNRQAMILFEADSVEQLQGIEGHELQVRQFTPQELAEIDHDIETTGAWSRELEYRTLRGRVFWGNLAARPIEVAGRHLTLVRLTDISERKTVESQLRSANHQLEITNAELARATQLKDEFLANMSHELRTPLNAVIGLAEGLSAEVYGPLNYRQRKTLVTIHRSGSMLLSLINDILDLSKIEAGKLELDMTVLNVRRLLESSLTFVRQMASTKHVQLECHYNQPVGSRYLGDERRLCQLLVNLLSNAVKFTPDGGRVSIEVNDGGLPLEAERALDGEISPERRAASWLSIAVADTGIGIAPEHLAKLFEPFTQIDSSLARAHNGTGLGLALVQRIAWLHGGAVTVDSTLGRGSCFRVWLPPSLVSPLPVPGRELVSGGGAGDHDDRERGGPAAALPGGGEGGRRVPQILIAEDNETNIQVLRDYLLARGYGVLLAHNGLEAVRLARSERPDLILMDVQMPLVDGLAATRRIRGDVSLAELPIVALTAHAMAGDRERCMEAGMTDYLAKPVKFPLLLEVIARLLPHVAVPAPRSTID